MRKGLIVALLLLACSREQPAPLSPPMQRDLAKQLPRSPRSTETLKVNPPPSVHVLGCYETEMLDRIPENWQALPRRIRLTDIERRSGLKEIEAWYRVESTELSHSEDELWLWTPLIGRRAELVIGNGISGWRLQLTEAERGFAGVATWYSDQLPIVHLAANVQMLRIPCD